MVYLKGLGRIYKFVKYARKRLNSDADYLRFQEYQAEQVYSDIEENLPIFDTDFVIDYGCGRGGYTEYFKKKFHKVIGVDFEKLEGKDSSYIAADLMTYKSKKPADFIFCASTIEHIKDQRKFLLNINRNLRMDCPLYLSFPPFYSPIGGHKAKPFHYLPEHIAIGLAKNFNRMPELVTCYEDMYGKWGLYKTNIGYIKQLLEESGFEIVLMKDRYLPFVNNFFSINVEFYCVKVG